MTRTERHTVARNARKAVDQRADEHARAFVRAVQNAIGPVAMTEGSISRVARRAQAISDAVYPVVTEALKSVTASRLQAFSADPFGLKNTTAARFMKFQAFVISQMEGERVTRAFVDYAKYHLTEALEQGLSNAEFYDSILDATGLGEISRWHAVTVLRTNMATAYSASVVYDWALAGAGNFPAWEFMAIDDAVVREEHLELNGRIFAATDMTNFPPIGFNCRCVGSPISREEMDAQGYTVEPRDAPVDSEFRNNAVQNFTAFAREHADVPGIKDAIKEFSE